MAHSTQQKAILSYLQPLLTDFPGLTEIHNVFSRHHVIVEDMVAEGDKVAKQWSVRATHTGYYMGIPATNKKTNMSGIMIYRIVDGKVKECVWSYDTYGFLVQVGVILSE